MKSISTTAKRLSAAVTALLLASGIAGCGANGAVPAGSTESGAASNKTITIAIMPGWNDYVTAMYSITHVLEEKGYTVNVKEFSDPSIVYLAGAKGDLDLFVGQPEKSHKPFIDQHKDKIEDLTTWYDNSRLYIGVPEYMSDDVQSIADLSAHASELDSTIVGIGQGTGLVKNAQEIVLPGYGLQDFKVQASSVAGMVTALKAATDAKKPIAVTTWTPYWANSAFKLRLLEDPKNLFGGAEGLHVLSRKGFSKDFPDVAAMIKALKVNDEQLAQADNMIVNEYAPGKEKEAVDAWLAKYPDILSALEKKLTS